jgi:hypothetical protein
VGSPLGFYLWWSAASPLDWAGLGHSLLGWLIGKGLGREEALKTKKFKSSGK